MSLYLLLSQFLFSVSPEWPVFWIWSAFSSLVFLYYTFVCVHKQYKTLFCMFLSYMNICIHLLWLFSSYVEIYTYWCLFELLYFCLQFIFLLMDMYVGIFCLFFCYQMNGIMNFLLQVSRGYVYILGCRGSALHLYWMVPNWLENNHTIFFS